MSQDSNLERLRTLLRESAVEERDWDGVGRDTTFEELGIDSLSILDLLYDVDQEFGIHLEGKDVVDLRSIGEFLDLLAERQSDQSDAE